MFHARRILAAVVILGVGVWIGYSVSAYRTYQRHLPVAQRFHALALASFMLRSADLIDKHQEVLLRGKLIAVARSQLEPLSGAPLSASTIMSMPLLLERHTDALEELNESDTDKLQAQLKTLEMTNPR